MLVNCMNFPETCTKTDWKSHDQLAKWGWAEVKDRHDEQQYRLDAIVETVKGPLDELEMQPKVETTAIHRWDNELSVEHEGVTYPVKAHMLQIARNVAD